MFCLDSMRVQFKRRIYGSNEKQLGKWLKQFFTLLFLACHKVNEAFTELISILLKDDVGYLFSDYILLRYIEDEWLFPPLQNCWQKTHQ